MTGTFTHIYYDCGIGFDDFPLQFQPNPDDEKEPVPKYSTPIEIPDSSATDSTDSTEYGDEYEENYDDPNWNGGGGGGSGGNGDDYDYDNDDDLDSTGGNGGGGSGGGGNGGPGGGGGDGPGGGGSGGGGGGADSTGG